MRLHAQCRDPESGEAGSAGWQGHRTHPPRARWDGIRRGFGAEPMRHPSAFSLRSDAPAPTLLIRLMVGGVFLSEGIQKFLEPASRGAGRFVKIGLPAAEFLGPLVGATEVLCGSLVLFGLLTRIAVLPLIATMVVAIATT